MKLPAFPRWVLLKVAMVQHTHTHTGAGGRYRLELVTLATAVVCPVGGEKVLGQTPLVRVTVCPSGPALMGGA